MSPRTQTGGMEQEGREGGVGRGLGSGSAGGTRDLFIQDGRESRGGVVGKIEL